MEGSPTIRYARREDVSLILRFIRQGAEDQAPGTVPTATEEALANTLHLSDVPSIPTQIGWPLLIFSPEGTPAGLLIYFHNLTTWHAAPGVCMEELYVAPEFRSLGYARMLVEAMTGAAQKAGCVKMEWNCLSDNERALMFYEKLGAEKMETWDILKVGKKGIEQLAVQGAWNWA